MNREKREELEERGNREKREELEERVNKEKKVDGEKIIYIVFIFLFKP
ncbi:TPA: hypothetical protein ACX6RC_003492 [Photobacterium damselae]